MRLSNLSTDNNHPQFRHWLGDGSPAYLFIETVVDSNILSEAPAGRLSSLLQAGMDRLKNFMTPGADAHLDNMLKYIAPQGGGLPRVKELLQTAKESQVPLSQNDNWWYMLFNAFDIKDQGVQQQIKQKVASSATAPEQPAAGAGTITDPTTGQAIDPNTLDPKARKLYDRLARNKEAQAASRAKLDALHQQLNPGATPVAPGAAPVAPPAPGAAPAPAAPGAAPKLPKPAPVTPGAAPKPAPPAPAAPPKPAPTPGAAPAPAPAAPPKPAPAPSATPAAPKSVPTRPVGPPPSVTPPPASAPKAPRAPMPDVGSYEARCPQCRSAVQANKNSPSNLQCPTCNATFRKPPPPLPPRPDDDDDNWVNLPPAPVGESYFTPIVMHLLTEADVRSNLKFLASNLIRKIGYPSNITADDTSWLTKFLSRRSSLDEGFGDWVKNFRYAAANPGYAGVKAGEYSMQHNNERAAKVAIKLLSDLISKEVEDRLAVANLTMKDLITSARQWATYDAEYKRRKAAKQPLGRKFAVKYQAASDLAERITKALDPQTRVVP